jgi:hypothetical protein
MTDTVTVHIMGELVVEASHLLPERWNGWAVPVFTEQQRDKVIAECVRLNWQDDGRILLDDFTDIGGGEWIARGWIWEEVQS